MSLALILITAFLLKHFVADFWLQTPYMYLNKGTFLHPGGILHAAIHWWFTLSVLICVGLHYELASVTTILRIAVGLAGLDMVTHYFIDLFKVKICKYKGWTPVNSEEYWMLLGLDQLLHGLTYVGIIYLFIGAK